MIEYIQATTIFIQGIITARERRKENHDPPQ